jgi:SPOR domain
MLALKFILTLTLLRTAGSDSAEYRRYENENVSVYRKRIAFEMPVVETPSETNPVIHVVRQNGSDTIFTTWDQPTGVDQLLSLHRPGGEIQIEGYRVQIYAGTAYPTAKKLKGEFVQAFPETNVYDTWASPHFRVRCGDFLSRNDALNFASRIKDKFPGAFVVPDKVKVRRNVQIVQPPDDGSIPPPDENGGE